MKLANLCFILLFQGFMFIINMDTTHWTIYMWQRGVEYNNKSTYSMLLLSFSTKLQVMRVPTPELRTARYTVKTEWDSFSVSVFFVEGVYMYLVCCHGKCQQCQLALFLNMSEIYMYMPIPVQCIYSVHSFNINTSGGKTL